MNFKAGKNCLFAGFLLILPSAHKQKYLDKTLTRFPVATHSDIIGLFKHQKVNDVRNVMVFDVKKLAGHRPTGVHHSQA